MSEILTRHEKIRLQIAKNIVKVGWHCFYIYPTQDDGSELETPFFYTVGLTEIGLPELFLSGALSPEIGHHVIRNMIQTMKRDGFVERIYTDIIQGRDGQIMPIDLRLIDPDARTVRDQYAVQLFEYYHGREDIQIAQVIWPDLNGKLPDDPDYTYCGGIDLLPTLRTIH